MVATSYCIETSAKGVPMISPMYCDNDKLATISNTSQIGQYMSNTLELTLQTADLTLTVAGVMSIFGFQKAGKSSLLNSLFGLKAPVGNSAAEATTEGSTAFVVELDGKKYLIIDTEGAVSIDKKAKINKALRSSPAYKESAREIRREMESIVTSNLQAYEDRLLALTISISDLAIFLMPNQLSGQETFLGRFADLASKLKSTDRKAALHIAQNIVPLDSYNGEFPVNVKDEIAIVTEIEDGFFQEPTFQQLPNFKEDGGRALYEKQIVKLKELAKQKVRLAKCQTLEQVKFALEQLLVGVNGENVEFSSLLAINAEFFDKKGRQIVEDCVKSIFGSMTALVDVFTDKELKGLTSNAKPMLVERKCPISVVDNMESELIHQITSKSSDYAQCRSKCIGGDRCRHNQKFESGKHEHVCNKISSSTCNRCGKLTAYTCHSPPACSCCKGKCKYGSFCTKNHADGIHKCDDWHLMECKNADKGCASKKKMLCGNEYYCGCCYAAHHGIGSCLKKNCDGNHFCQYCCPGTCSTHSAQCLFTTGEHRHQCAECCTKTCNNCHNGYCVAPSGHSKCSFSCGRPARGCAENGCNVTAPAGATVCGGVWRCDCHLSGHLFGSPRHHIVRGATCRQDFLKLNASYHYCISGLKCEYSDK
ncbi:hypothetical protein HDV06_001354 [Boothiomyces sp. JEL0866]|nr:hypothetical protein HDV06_001354 [Boothiomyces sp. JEL0866]